MFGRRLGVQLSVKQAPRELALVHSLAVAALGRPPIELSGNAETVAELVTTGQELE